MALQLYQRHRKQCEGGHAEDSRTGEFEQGRRGWKKCACTIHVSGTLGGKFQRKQTGTADWAEAKLLVAGWEKANSWSGRTETAPPPGLPSTPGPASAPGRVTIAAGMKAFLSNREAAQISQSTRNKYKIFKKRLLAFTDSRGYVMLDQITTTDMDVFYSQWKLGVRAKGKGLGTLRAFFRFCVNRKWIPENPVSADLKPPLGANRVANKAPYTDEELQRILDGCDQLGETVWFNAGDRGIWSGEDVKEFIWVLIYTGMRISDVCLLSMDRLQGNELFLRAKKNGGDVFAYIPDWLRDRLHARAARRGSRPFAVGHSDRLDTITDMWRRKIRKVFALAGPFAEPPTPHRFRHTFARILLQRGVSAADVADLLADNEKTVREHYSRWVPERQARLTKILKEAFEDKPRPKLVAVAGGREHSTREMASGDK